MKDSKILIVDDDLFIRDVLQTRLEWEGYQIALAENGREALELHQQDKCDLILLDINMPVMDGFAVMQQLREKEDTTPVVVMSALEDIPSIVRSIELGAEDYITKPIKSQLLWARIHSSLEKKAYREREQMRLAELKLLRQIDRALNTTLDLEEVAALTLKYAQQKTGALAGLVGSVVKDRLYIRASAGIERALDDSLPLAELALEPEPQEIMQRPIRATVAFHPQAIARLVLPIRRNQVINDVVILDLAEICDDASLGFLQQLATYAAISSHNAQLYADVQAANLAKSSFVAMVSHELRNLLTAVQASIHLLQRISAGQLSERQEKYLNIISDSTHRIQNLTLELDDITRMETGHVKLELTHLSLAAVTAHVVRLLAQQIDANKQQLTIDIPPDLPPIYADEQRLSQILTNLISNAHKYSNEAGEIRITAQRLAQEAGQFVKVTVQDSGIGISAENQKHIFTQFFRVNETPVRQQQGTGLGLYITKKLVEIQNGQIGFTSTAGQGSSFFFTLPLATTGDDVVAGEAATVHQEQKMDGLIR
jgi:signal transduction histidine kinase